MRIHTSTTWQLTNSGEWLLVSDTFYNYNGPVALAKKNRDEKKALAKPFNSRDFLPGTVADRIQREWLRSNNPLPGQMVQMVPDMIERYTNPDRLEEDFRPVRWKGDPAADRRAVQDTSPASP